MDVVVTVPQQLWAQWLSEGDLAGGPSMDQEYVYRCHPLPNIKPGERVYVAAHGLLRGCAPLVRLAADGLVRAGGAVAVTIPETIKGFRGFRYRWWDRADELPFPDWQTP
jgi:hypothetical protein